MGKVTFFAGLLILFATNAGAQSLKEFMDMAVQNNYDIRISRLQEDIAENNNSIGNAGFLPSVDVEGQYSNSYNTTQQQFFDGDIREGDNAKNTNLSASALANWTVFDGFRMFANHDRLQLLEEQGAANVRFYIDQSLADIATVYYQIIKEEGILANFRETLKVSKYRVTLEEKRREVGTGIGLDYHQAMASFQNDSSQVLAQLSLIRSLEIQLNRITNRSLDLPVVPEDSIVMKPLAWDANELTLLAGQRNSELKQAQLEEMIAETNIRYEKADRFPAIDLFGGYSYNRSTSEIGFTESNRSYGTNYGVRFRFNLFNGGNQTREIRNAEIGREISTNSLKQVEQSVDAEIIEQLSTYNYLSQQIVLANQSVQSAEKALEVANAQLRESVITGIDFRTIQVSVITAENNLQQLNYMQKTVEINLFRLTSQVMVNYM